MSIKAYNSTVKEFFDVIGFMGVSAVYRLNSLIQPKYVYTYRFYVCIQYQRVKSLHRESTHQSMYAHRFHIVSAQICAQNKNGIQKGGSTVGVALSCAF